MGAMLPPMPSPAGNSLWTMTMPAAAAKIRRGVGPDGSHLSGMAEGQPQDQLILTNIATSLRIFSPVASTPFEMSM